MSYTHTTLIVTAAQQAIGQAICSACIGPEGEGMLIAGLSPSGTSPATHFISSGDMESVFAAALREATSTPLYDLCIVKGMNITAQEVDDFLTTSNVSDAIGKEQIAALYLSLGVKKIPRGL